MTYTVDSLYKKFQDYYDQQGRVTDYDWFVQSIDNNLEAGKTLSRVFTTDEFYFLVDNIL